MAITTSLMMIILDTMEMPLMNATRYCEDKLWQGAVSTYYEVMIMMNGNYQLSDGGTPVVIDQPKTLELIQLHLLLQIQGLLKLILAKLIHYGLKALVTFLIYLVEFLILVQESF